MDQILEKVTKKLLKLGHTVTCAESCTGGLLAAQLTQLAGSSAWFNMSYVTYSNQAKQQLLNVKETTLKKYGAVSQPCVEEMARGALLHAKADYALAISGIAGPSGGSSDRPVGTVWFGLSTTQHTMAHVHHFSGNRDAVRSQATQFALTWLYEYLYAK